jgi:hypothetical protein
MTNEEIAERANAQAYRIFCLERDLVAANAEIASAKIVLRRFQDELLAQTNHVERYDAAKHALMGLLADHKEHGEECKNGESCTDAVARLAVEHGDALLKQLASPKNLE